MNARGTFVLAIIIEIINSNNLAYSICEVLIMPTESLGHIICRTAVKILNIQYLGFTASAFASERTTTLSTLGNLELDDKISANLLPCDKAASFRTADGVEFVQ